MYPYTYYEVLELHYEETGETEERVYTDSEGRPRAMTVYWQAVVFTPIKNAKGQNVHVESMEEAKLRFGGTPILQPVGFWPKEYE